MDSRLQRLNQWLSTHCQLENYGVEIMQGDASFRRYFRLHIDRQSYVAMDAPPPRENCVPFVLIANTLRENGLHTPVIMSEDLQEGFLLLSDLGNKVYLKELTVLNAEKLYQCALDALSHLQSVKNVSGFTLPLFTSDFIQQELQLFSEWFLKKHLHLTLSYETEEMLAAFFKFLALSAVEQPQVFMHRDYHSGNLMVLPNNQVGILDFQDAFIGPVTYDLVSLLRDCYIDWPDSLVQTLALYYKKKLLFLDGISDEKFLRQFDLMGLQRHLKALLTFSRKYHRDDSAAYLQFIPRTLSYVTSISARYPECQPFNRYLHEVILPALEKVSLSCEL